MTKWSILRQTHICLMLLRCPNVLKSVAFSSCCTGIVGLQYVHQRAHYFTWKLALPLTQFECHFLNQLNLGKEKKNQNATPLQCCFVSTCVELTCTFPCVPSLRPDTTTQAMQSSMPAVWVKMSSSWLGLGLYLWTLIAPLIFPDRDFNWVRLVF